MDIQNTTLGKETINEYHPNGALAYTTTWAMLDNSKGVDYRTKCIEFPDGTLRIRTGVNGKYRADGSKVWELHYDETGEVIPSNS
jgi:hypothetical protein